MHQLAMLVYFILASLLVLMLFFANLGAIQKRKKREVRGRWIKFDGRRIKVKRPFVLPDRDMTFLDIETDPLQSYIWVIGVYADVKVPVFKQFVAKDPSEEKTMLEEFLNFVKKHPNAILCHYSGTGFDKRLIQRRLRHYDLPSEFLVMKDLFSSIRSAFAFGSYKLKYVGSRFGYKFKHPNLDGGLVSLQYERYLKDKDEELLQRLLEYNEDDVRVLHHIIKTIKKNPEIKIKIHPVVKRKVEKIGEDLYRVSSFTVPNLFYTVNLYEESCSCPYFQKNHKQCKHIRWVKERATYTGYIDGVSGVEKNN